MVKSMKGKMKIIFDNAKVALICAALLTSCLTFLYAYGQFDHLRLQVEASDEKIKVVSDKNNELISKIDEIEKKQNNARLFFDKVQLKSIETDTKLFMFEIEMNAIEQAVEANYTCYYLKDYITKLKNKCRKKNTKKECGLVEKYKNSCLKIDKDGQRVISSNPDIYSQMLLEVADKENKNVKPEQ